MNHKNLFNLLVCIASILLPHHAQAQFTALGASDAFLPAVTGTATPASTPTTSQIYRYISSCTDANNNVYWAVADGYNSCNITLLKYPAGGGSVTKIASIVKCVTHVPPTGQSGAQPLAVACDASNNIYVAFNDSVLAGRITVVKYNGIGWVTVGSMGMSAGRANNINIAITAGGTIYVAYTDYSLATYKASVRMYNGTSWTYAGSQGFTAGSADHLSLTLDASGNPYLAFNDGANSNKLSVMSFNGSSWSLVGTAGLGSGAASYISMKIYPTNNTIYVAFRDAGNSGKGSVYKYNGSTWSTYGGTLISNGGTSVYGMSLAINSSGTVYLAFSRFVSTSNSYTTVMYYNGGSFVQLGESKSSYGAYALSQNLCIDANNNIYLAQLEYSQYARVSLFQYSSSNLAFLPLHSTGGQGNTVSAVAQCTNPNGQPMVLYADMNNGKRATVKCYYNSTWNTLGATGFNLSSVTSCAISAYTNYKPFIAFNDSVNSSRLSIAYYNGSYWSYLNQFLSAGTASYISSAFDASGNYYVACQDGSILLLYKFNGSTWTNLSPGTTYYNSSSASYLSFCLDAAGNPVLAYRNSASPNKMSAIRYSSSAWAYVGSSGFTSGAVTQISVCSDASSNIYVSYSDAANSGKATVMQYNGSAWAVLGSSGLSTGTVSTTEVVCDGSNNVWLLYADNSNMQKLSVQKYSASAWSSVASSFTYGAALFPVLNYNSNSGVVISYYNDNVFTYINQSSSNYTSGTPPTSSYTAGYTAVNDTACPNTDDHPYNTLNPYNGNVVTIVDNNVVMWTAFVSKLHGNRLALLKYTNGAWTEYISNYFPSLSRSQCLTLSYAGTDATTTMPVIAFVDSLSYNQISMVNFDGSNFNLIGTCQNNFTGWNSQSFSIFAGYTSLGNPGVQFLFIAYQDPVNGNRLSIVKFSTSNYSSVKPTNGLGFSANTANNITIFSNNSSRIYTIYKDYANAGKATCYSYSNASNSWTALGSAGFTSGSFSYIYSTAYITIAGYPYIAYKDSATGYPNIVFWNGTTWSTLGSVNFTTPSGGNCSNLCLQADGSGTLYLGCTDDSRSSRFMILKYDGSNWVYAYNPTYQPDAAASLITGVTAVLSPGTPSMTFSYCDAYKNNMLTTLVQDTLSDNWFPAYHNGATYYNTYAPGISKDGLPFIFEQDYANSNFGSLLYYTGASWANYQSAGFTPGAINWPALAFDVYNNPVVAFADSTVSGKLSIMNWNGSAWVKLGSAGLSAAALTTPPILAIDKNNKTYVAYTDVNNGNSLVVLYFNGTFWTTLSSALSTGAASSICMATDSSNNLIVAFIDAGVSGKVIAKKYASNTWTNLGSASGVSGNKANSVALAIAPNNYPWVAYTDGINSNKITVKYISSSSWLTLSSIFTGPGLSKLSLTFDYSGALYLTYIDSAQNYRAAFQKYASSAWSSEAFLSATFAQNTAVFSHILFGTVFTYYTDYVYTNSLPISYRWMGGMNNDISQALNWYPRIAPASYNSTQLYTYFPKFTYNYPELYSGNLTLSSPNSYTTILNSPYFFLDQNTALIINSKNISADSTQFKYGGALILTPPSVAQSLSTKLSTFHYWTNSGPFYATTLGGSTLTTDSLFAPNTTSSGPLITSSLLYFSNLAYIVSSVGGVSISGNISYTLNTTLARRAFRFIGHPFSTYLPLSQIESTIDVTGLGAGANGFTQTYFQTPSAYWYNTATGNSSVVNDPTGWKSFGSCYTTGTDSNAWKQYMGIRLLIRGAKGQGLDGLPYTPQTANLYLTGPPNQGTQIITLANSANSGYNLISNPYLCPVNMDGTARGSALAGSFYVWDPSLSTQGAYTAVAFGTGYVLPATSAFFLQTTASSNNTITFYESAKNPATPSLVFKPNGASPFEEHLILSLNSTDTTIVWDKLQYYFNKASSNDSDFFDAPKLHNFNSPEFYSYASNGSRLAIDSRPFPGDSTCIVLGFANLQPGTFTLRTEAFKIAPGSNLFFTDWQTKTTLLMDSNFTYTFTKTTDTAIDLDDRFTIGQCHNFNYNQANTITIYPNPAHTYFDVSFTNITVGQWKWELFTLDRKLIDEGEQTLAAYQPIKIACSKLPSSAYLLKVSNGKNTFSKVVVKQ